MAWVLALAAVLSCSPLGIPSTLLVSVAAQDLGPGPEPGIVTGPEPGPTIAGLSAIRGLVYARRFHLDEGYAYEWSREGLEVEDGYILVLEVEPEFVRPLQTGMPVLYVGDRPAEIVNGDSQSARVIAIAPGNLDLSNVPIFYGSTRLPEQVDAARGREENAAAVALGVSPTRTHELAGALAAGGSILQAADRNALYRSLAEVVAEYSPAETDLIDALELIP